MVKSAGNEADPVERPKALSPVEAYEAIQRVLAFRDSISLAPHARKRMVERLFNVDDVRRVLERGTVSPTPVWDEKYQNWRYQVSGRGYDNEPLVLVVALEPAIGRITIITGKDD